MSTRQKKEREVIIREVNNGLFLFYIYACIWVCFATRSYTVCIVHARFHPFFLNSIRTPSSVPSLLSVLFEWNKPKLCHARRKKNFFHKSFNRWHKKIAKFLFFSSSCPYSGIVLLLFSHSELFARCTVPVPMSFVLPWVLLRRVLMVVHPSHDRARLSATLYICSMEFESFSSDRHLIEPH